MVAIAIAIAIAIAKAKAGSSMSQSSTPRRKAPSLSILLGLLTACSAPAPLPEDLDAAMRDLERRTLADVVTQYPESATQLGEAAGYAVFSNHATKAPIVGGGEGIGVAVDRKTGRRTHLRISHFDVGGGLGDLDYRLVIIFLTRSDFEKLKAGTLNFGASVNVAGGADDTDFRGVEQSTSEKKDRRIYILTDSGAAASWSIRALRFSAIEEP